MTYRIIQIVLFMSVVLLLTKLRGWYMAQIYENKPCGLDRILGPLVEKGE
jgi:K+-transporting ATPase ATPase A chain